MIEYKRIFDDNHEIIEDEINVRTGQFNSYKSEAASLKYEFSSEHVDFVDIDNPDDPNYPLSRYAGEAEPEVVLSNIDNVPVAKSETAPKKEYVPSFSNDEFIKEYQNNFINYDTVSSAKVVSRGEVEPHAEEEQIIFEDICNYSDVDEAVASITDENVQAVHEPPMEDYQPVTEEIAMEKSADDEAAKEPVELMFDIDNSEKNETGEIKPFSFGEQIPDVKKKKVSAVQPEILISEIVDESGSCEDDSAILDAIANNMTEAEIYAAAEIQQPSDEGFVTRRRLIAKSDDEPDCSEQNHSGEQDAEDFSAKECPKTETAREETVISEDPAAEVNAGKADAGQEEDEAAGCIFDDIDNTDAATGFDRSRKHGSDSFEVVPQYGYSEELLEDDESGESKYSEPAYEEIDPSELNSGKKVNLFRRRHASGKGQGR